MDALEARYRTFAAGIGDTPESYEAAQLLLGLNPGIGGEFWPLYNRLGSEMLARPIEEQEPDPERTPVAYARWHKMLRRVLTGAE